MIQIFYALAPFITSAITGWVKGLPAFSSLSDEARTPAVRVLAAVVSLVYAFVTLWVTGHIDEGAVVVASNVLLEALLGWLGSIGLFHVAFAKKQ